MHRDGKKIICEEMEKGGKDPAEGGGHNASLMPTSLFPPPPSMTSLELIVVSDIQVDTMIVVVVTDLLLGASVLLGATVTYSVVRSQIDSMTVTIVTGLLLVVSNTYAVSTPGMIVDSTAVIITLVGSGVVERSDSSCPTSARALKPVISLTKIDGTVRRSPVIKTSS